MMITIREAKPNEYSELGELMVEVYSQLEGFPGPDEIPEYYHHLKNVGELAMNPKTKLFVAINNNRILEGGLVYYGDLKYYGAGGEEVIKQKAGAFRLLAVKPESRGKGVGKKLIEKCVFQAKEEGFKNLIIHSTKYMMLAWKMYERMGFQRFPEIDFEKNGVSVYGFMFVL